MTHQNKTIFTLLLGLILLYSFSGNPPQSRTGAPGEATCAGSNCHTINPGIKGRIRITGLPDNIEPAKNYALKLNIDNTSGRAFLGGFQMTVLDKDDQPIGTLANPGESSTIQNSNGREYFEHEPAQSFNNDTTVTYSVVWTTPATLSDDTITFYAVSILSNGDGGNSNDGFIRQSFERIVSAPDKDEDDDGFNKDVDCDDSNPNINPGAAEIPDNNIDENCDGLIETTPIDTMSNFIFSFISLKGEGVSNISVELAQKDSIVAISAASGLIEIPSTLAGRQVTFTKEGKAIDGVSAADLVVISNHIIGRNVLTDPALLDAADANKSNSISAADLVQFKNILLGKWDSLPARDPWAFLPTTLTLPTTLIPDTIKITTYKIGDLNRSVDPK